MSDSNEPNPWKREAEGPPDLLQILQGLFGGSTQRAEPMPPQFRRYLWLGLGVLLLLWFITGFFLVSPAEEAVVTRFGRYARTVGQGPHWIPRFIESKKTLNVQQISTFNYKAEMLTQDENIVSVALAIQYRIDNGKAFLFHVNRPIMTLEQATSSALRQVVGQMTLDDVLTTGREVLRETVREQLIDILSNYQAGLLVTDVTLQPAKPPEAVTHAFDDAIKAREDEQRYINQAEAYARRVESIVEGQTARLAQSAKAYAAETVLKAKGDVLRFLAILAPYQQAPKVTRERLYQDAMTQIFSHTHNVVVSDKANAPLLYMPLASGMPKLKSQAHVAQGESHEAN